MIGQNVYNLALGNVNKYPDLVFRCRKCSHLLFINKKYISKLMEDDSCCPKCGEDSYENWILSREGDYEDEYDEDEETDED